MQPTRREALATIGTAGLWAATHQAMGQVPRKEVSSEDRITHGKIRQSVMGWCFKPMKAATLAKHCREIGLEAIEGISPGDYPAVKELGLKISLVSSHGFKQGPFSRDNHAFCIEKLKQSIDLAVDVGCPNVITFTGMRENGISDKAAAQNCVDCWNAVIGYAEEKKINLC
ncbi:MAG: TIM barrel protein, partial [Planctomycetaceae bacterium]|nr:TIM barrel protein [Planctomycetaceae bacterium]